MRDKLKLSTVFTLSMLFGSAAAHAAPVQWTSWTAASAGASSTASGTITDRGATSTVSFSGQIYGFQVNDSGTNFFAPVTTYQSANVDNAPGRKDILQLSVAANNTLTFSRPISNLVMAFVSFNNDNMYTFDHDFTIEMTGPGFYGVGTVERIDNGNGTYSLHSLTGEPHGIIRFPGDISALRWTSRSELWNGFTVGSQTIVDACSVDTDCSGGKWCNISTNTCTAPVSNGGSVPTDAAHTTPVLNGVCSTAAGALTCASGVCDTRDNKCGFDNLGSSSCTSGTAGTVCRSGLCSAAGKCIAAGSCADDADCSGGKWCNISTNTCTSPSANGAAVATDASHVTPVLNGTCSAAAGALVCASGVCDTRDNLCGYDNGGSSACTSSNAATVCRSGFCGANGKCLAASACAVDGDCPSAWCNVAAAVCGALQPNGASMPTDASHGTPVIDGTCSAAAGALVCASGVCDTDNRCGRLNGSACTGLDTQCRSGKCFAADMKCGLPNGNACTQAGDCRSNNCISGMCGDAVMTDAGAPDGGADAGQDSGTSSDAGQADGGAATDAGGNVDAGGEASMGGSISGGGIDCNMGAPSTGSGAMLLVMGAAFLGRRARKR